MRLSVRPRGLLVVASVGTLALSACTLLLSKEPLACTLAADCDKYPGTRCVRGECRSITDPTFDAGIDPPSDAALDGTPGDCLAAVKPLVVLKGDIDEDRVLRCENDYLLSGRVVVLPARRLAIGAGTKIYGSTAADVLVVRPGGQLIARGLADSPIVFTGQAGASWGGVVLLGEAPVSLPNGTGSRSGIAFGGQKAGDTSGHLEHVRIEYAVSSLELDGVGAGTVIDKVMLRFPSADCVSVVGGTVNLKHVLCQHPFDDGIAWNSGWTGNVQFVVVQARPKVDNDSNGLEGKSDNALPVSNPTIFNGTFCGQNSLPSANRTNQQYGVRVESGSQVTIANSIFMGWEALIDVRADASDAGVPPNLRFTSSLAFGNVPANVAYVELGGALGTPADPNFDDDNGFDETAWWRSVANKNSEDNPKIAKCFDPKSPSFGPPAPIGMTAGAPGSPEASSPPNDGFFDSNANYLGAFKDENDKWAVGKWVLWDDH